METQQVKKTTNTLKFWKAIGGIEDFMKITVYTNKGCHRFLSMEHSFQISVLADLKWKRWTTQREHIIKNQLILVTKYFYLLHWKQ